MRDKFLTEAMGECWHETDWGQTICKHCRRTNDPRYFDFDTQNSTFSTWEGFGKLVGYMNEHHLPWMVSNMTLALLDPDKFATQVYNYLTSKNIGGITVESKEQRR